MGCVAGGWRDRVGQQRETLGKTRGAEGLAPGCEVGQKQSCMLLRLPSVEGWWEAPGTRPIVNPMWQLAVVKWPWMVGVWLENWVLGLLPSQCPPTAPYHPPSRGRKPQYSSCAQLSWALTGGHTHRAVADGENRDRRGTTIPFLSTTFCPAKDFFQKSATINSSGKKN